MTSEVQAAAGTPARRPSAGAAGRPAVRASDRLRIVDGDGAIGALESAGWDDLLQEQGHDPLRSAEVLALEQPDGWRQRPRAVIVERDGGVVAAAALGVRRERGLETVRHLGHPSGWLAPDPVVVDADAGAELLTGLLRQSGDVLVLEDLTASGPLVRSIHEICPGAQIIPGPATFRAPTDASGRAVSKRRSEVRRLERRAAERGAPVQVEVTSGWDDEMERRIDELLAFQATCRQDEEMDPFTATPEGRRCAARAIAALGRRGALRVAVATAGERIAAFHLALVSGDQAVGYKCASARDVEGLTGFGWATMLAMNDALAAEGVRSIDLGHGGEAYKAHLSGSEQLVTVRAALSRLGRAYLALGSRVRRAPRAAS